MNAQREEQSLRILLVEDDAATAIFLSKLLQQQSYTVLTADSGEAALGSLGQQRIEVVITDLQMAGMGGHRLLDHMAEDYPLIPAIVLTSSSTLSTMLDCLREGALAFCSKPLGDGQVLLEAVALAEQLWRHRRQQLQHLAQRNRQLRGGDSA